MEFLHTMIRVKDIKNSLHFYENLLEMKLVKEKRMEDRALYFLTDANGLVQIELTHTDEISKNGYEIGTGFGHFAFKVDSMDEFVEKAHTLGYEFLYEPYKLTPTGSTIAFIKDPDGYEIELIEKT